MVLRTSWKLPARSGKFSLPASAYERLRWYATSSDPCTSTRGSGSASLSEELLYVKRYENIVKHARQAKHEYMQQITGPVKKPFLGDDVFVSRKESRGPNSLPPSVGHLIVTAEYGPAVLLELPSASKQGCYLVYISSGEVKQIRPSSVLFSLGEYVHEHVLNDLVVEVKSLSSRSNDDEKQLRLFHPLHRVLYRPLRRFIETANRQLEAAAVAISNIFSSLQKKDQSVTITFFDLVREVDYRLKLGSKEFPSVAGILALSGESIPPSEFHERVGDRQPSPELGYIVYNSIKHNYSSSVVSDIGPSGKGSFTITILSGNEISIRRGVSKFLDGKTKQHDDQLLSLAKKYALGDINPTDTNTFSTVITKFKERISGTTTDTEKIEPRVVLKYLSENSDDRSAKLDLDVGPFIDRERYSFLKYENPTLHSAIIAEEFDSMSSQRTDASPEPVYCIDGEFAKEIDDGVSVKIRGYIATVTVHIADPCSSWSQLDDNPLLSQAYFRTSTAYYPTKTIPMFPEHFTAKFGLVADDGPTGASGRRTFAMSFDFDLKKRTVINESETISPQFVRNVVPLTYDEVDQILTEPNQNSPYYRDLLTLLEISQSLRKHRADCGSIPLTLPSSQVYVDLSEKNISVKTVNTSSQSQSASTCLVSELMIKANNITGTYTHKMGIPNIYRSQSLRFDTPADKQFFDSVVRAISSSSNDKQVPLSSILQCIKSMEPASFSLQPQRHLALAIDCYTHATSPLRRMQDIIAHWQIEASIRGDTNKLLSEYQLKAVIQRLSSFQRLIRTSENQSNLYWIIRYIERTMMTSPVSQRKVVAIVTDSDVGPNRLQAVYLQDFCIFAKLQLADKGKGPWCEPLPVGETIECTLEDVDPLTMTVVVG